MIRKNKRDIMFASSQLSKTKLKKLRKIAEDYNVPNHLELSRAEIISALEKIRKEKLEKLSWIQCNLMNCFERLSTCESDLKEEQRKLEIVNNLLVVVMSEEKKRDLEKRKESLEDYLELMKGYMHVHKIQHRICSKMDAEMQEEIKEMTKKFE